MSDLSEEYKEYLLNALDEIRYELTLSESIRDRWKIDYLDLRIRNIKNDTRQFDTVYDPKGEFTDFDESHGLLIYNNWLYDRRKRGIDSICES